MEVLKLEEAAMVVGKMEGMTPLGVELLKLPTLPAAITTAAGETIVTNKPFSSTQ